MRTLVETTNNTYQKVQLLVPFLSWRECNAHQGFHPTRDLFTKQHSINTNYYWHLYMLQSWLKSTWTFFEELKVAKTWYLHMWKYWFVTVEPRFNEVLRDWGNFFVISRVRYIENLYSTNFREYNQRCSLYRGIVNNYYYSFKIFHPRFWLVKSTRIIHHN